MLIHRPELDDVISLHCSQQDPMMVVNDAVSPLYKCSRRPHTFLINTAAQLAFIQLYEF